MTARSAPHIRTGICGPTNATQPRHVDGLGFDKLVVVESRTVGCLGLLNGSEGYAERLKR